MSDTAAYNLRMRSGCQDFRRAWVVALDYSSHRIDEDARTRSRRGVARPIFYKPVLSACLAGSRRGEQVGEWRHHDERLTMFFLRTRFPERYGKRAERLRGPDEEPAEEPGIALEGALTCVEFGAKDVPPEDVPAEGEHGDDYAPGDGAPEQP